MFYLNIGDEHKCEYTVIAIYIKLATSEKNEKNFNNLNSDF